jgi:hypothetical protein
MTDYEKFLTRLVAAYQGKKIIGVIAGGGVSLARIAMVPGSSKILGAMWMPYDEDETVTWMEAREVDPKAFSNQAVCGKAAGELFMALAHVYADNAALVAVTGALTTNRYRRGENAAYISIDPETAYKLTFDKLAEDVYSDPIKPWVEQKIFYKRQEEDEQIAEVALKLLTGFEADTLKALYDNGNLTKILL